ncbi:hypothetical protein [Microbacterium petrolearium]|jgi:hypothetical protein
METSWPHLQLSSRYSAARNRFAGALLGKSLVSASTDVHQALLEGGYLAEPDVPSGFLETSLGVDRHLFKARALSRVHVQEAAFRARAFVHARRRVRPVTVAERDLAQQEVLLEVAPLRLRRLSELALGSRAPTPFDEALDYATPAEVEATYYQSREAAPALT